MNQASFSTLSPLTQECDAPPIRAAKDVIAQEIKGLEALHQVLDEHFLRAVELLWGCRGRIILSGMGKSGHVARKIAATLSSTGTPAFFVHPGEASHGDLGMITKDDVLILLSNSGETAELHDMIHYAKRFTIPMIGIVRRPTSLLVAASTIALILPAVEEASPTGAPTTSTTMMLALGDALAIALLDKRGFTKDDFGIFHPGGKLGSQLLKVKELMHQQEALPLVDPNQTMAEVLITMTAKKMGCAAVVNEQQELLGIITDGDLRRHMHLGLLSLNANDVMTKTPITISESSFATEALAMMNKQAITTLFVKNQKNVVVGILHIHDCIRAGVA